MTLSRLPRSSRQPANWPNDPRRAFRTFSNRIDWDSLRQAFANGAVTLKEQPERYGVMAKAARREVEEQFSEARVERDLLVFLEKVAGQTH